MPGKIKQYGIHGLTVLGLAACTSVPTPTDLTAQSSIVNHIAERLLVAENEGASGFLYITQGEEVLYESGFGSASCSRIEEITPSHLFMIGSITKVLTGVLGFVLEEKRYLSFDKTVGDYLPGFHGDIGKVKIRQLLHHTGGLPDMIDALGQPVTDTYTIDFDYTPVNRDELIDRVELAKLRFEPGEKREYSNLGFQILAAIYEVVTGKSYQTLLQQYIFEPTGMTNTGYWFDDNVKRQFADGCQSGGSHWGNPIDESMWDSTGPSWNLIGAGGLLSTAESLGLFFQGIGDGVYFESATQSERYKDDRMGYLEKYEQRAVGMGGTNNIFSSIAFWADRSKFNFILMTNRTDHPAGGQLYQDLLQIFPDTYFSSGEI